MVRGTLGGVLLVEEFCEIIQVLQTCPSNNFFGILVKAEDHKLIAKFELWRQGSCFKFPEYLKSEYWVTSGLMGSSNSLDLKYIQMMI